MRTLTFFLVMCFTSSFAAPPSLDVGDKNIITIVAGKPFKLSPKTDAKTVIWVGEKNLDILYEGEFTNKADVVLLSETLGTYTLTGVPISDKGEAKKQTFKVIVVKGDGVIPPDPVPVPDPPTPTPVVARKLYVYFVEQTLDAAKIKSNLFTAGQPLRKWQDAGGHMATAFPINTNDPSLLKYAKAAEGKKLPYMFVVALTSPTTGEIVFQGPTPDAPVRVTPTGPDSILDILKKAESK